MLSSGLHRTDTGILAVTLAAALLNLSIAPYVGVAAAQVGAAPDSSAASLEEARELIKSADYEQAVKLLQESVLVLGDDPDLLREAYLSLVETYVLVSNGFRDQGDDLSSDLYSQRAEQVILECLQTPALRDTRPDPAVVPPEMVQLFQEVRGRIFGSFEVTQLEPPQALVILDSDTLSASPETGLPGATSVPVGSHKVTVLADGYRTQTGDVEITPETTYAKSYKLEKGRSTWWYVLGGAAIVAGGVAVAVLAGGESSAPTSLPAPPQPPGSP